jgi:hypothetical protein
VNIRTDYMRHGKKHTYTPEEQHAKDNLPIGWVWKMPERIPFDPRDDDQRYLDAMEEMRSKRAAQYPPIEDLADALYWQTRGDPSKMVAYLLACDEVKQKIPKKE